MSKKPYDPVKAHEYYERHKHLKGRHSTRGMSYSQKQMAYYVKNQMNVQKERDIRKAAVKSQERAAERRKRFSDVCNSKIASLKSILKNMPEDKKADARMLIEAKIKSLRGEFVQRKKQVTANYSAGLKSEKDKIRKNYSNRYASALSQIRGK